MKQLNVLAYILLFLQPLIYITTFLNLHFKLKKINIQVFTLIFLFFLPMTISATEWIKSADNRSAYTNPVPYDNFSDITETLTIPGATTINVIVSGRTENNYDFLYITDSAGNTRTFDDRINITYTAVGPDITIRFVSDYSITSDGVVITINDDRSLTSNNPRPFTKVNVAGQTSTNIYGDLLVIGNQSLCWKDGKSTCQQPSSTASNNDYYQSNINLDATASNAGYLNSTSANLTLNPNDRVVEAWLYWIGRLDTDNETTRASAANIRLKTPTSGGYVALSSDTNKFNWMVDGDIFDYGAAIDITQYVQQGGTYWVADLKATEMRNQGSGWTIAVIVEDTARNKIRTLKNISLYDGFTGVFNSGDYPATVSSTISGFFTPRSGTVKSNLIVFAGESDRSLNDSMSLTRKDGTEIDIQDSLGNTNNVQNGTISRNGLNVTSRSPNYENTLGIDIDEIDVSHIIQNEQTSTTIKVDSNNDRIFLGMYGFATELYIPRLCYDYNVRKNGFTLDAENRDITTVGTGNLAINVSIRSMEGDFDLSTSKLKLRLTPSDQVSFVDALYSPNTINTLIPAVYTAASTTQYPEIGIGQNISTTPTLGGDIGIYERYFSAFNYDITNPAFSGHFEADLNTSIDFGSGPVNILLSTENDTLPRCEQSNIYSPQWGMFNIERVDSNHFNPVTEANQRFPLYTQVVGRDFEFSLVAYDGDATPSYSKEISIANITVDVELIDASPYDDNGSFFKCTNTDPSIIQKFQDGRRNFLVTFPSTPTSRIDLADSQNINIQTDTALRNAAFRMWLPVDKNNTIVPHQCKIDDNTCFEDIYQNPVNSSGDPTEWSNTCSTYCNAPCTTGSNPTGTSGCYECIRTYCTIPICSRDNFSIKPASYRVSISDTDESISAIDPTTLLATNDTSDLVATLAAGYQYKLDANATQFQTDAIARGYTRNFYTPSSSDLLSELQFNSISGICNDTNNSDLGIRFEDGSITGTIKGNSIDIFSNNLQEHNNVGIYNYHIEDNNWTIVDQARNPNKTFKNVSDCIENDSSISVDGNEKSGCGISSKLDSTLTYTDMQLRFEPYTYDVRGILMSTPNNTNTLYTNNLNTNNIVSRAMAVRFRGPLVARGKKGNSLSNYTRNCVASDVMFDINRTITQNNNIVNENNISAINRNDGSIGDKISFQRYNSSSDTNTTLQFSTENNDTNSSVSIIVTSFQFRDEDNGSANISLEYNFQRLCTQATNPMHVNFTFKEANSTLATSSAHMIKNYIPVGTETINGQVDFIYGRIATGSQNQYIIPRSQTQITIPFFTEAYCQSPALDGSSIDCGLYGLTLPSMRDTGTWWVNSKHDSSKGDGDICTLEDLKSPSPLTITPNTNIPLTNPTNVTISINPSFPRPYITSIVIQPCVPWLGGKPACNDSTLDPIVNFQGGGGWAGKGNTGLVVDSNSSYDDSNKRTEW